MHDVSTSAMPPQGNEHPARGRHLLLTLRQCDRTRLNDEQFLQELIRSAASATGATVLSVAGHRFEPQGVTVVAVLAESHASLHTYPESGVVFWDCFTCGDRCDPEKSIEVLQLALDSQKVEWQVIQR